MSQAFNKTASTNKHHEFHPPNGYNYINTALNLNVTTFVDVKHIVPCVPAAPKATATADNMLLQFEEKWFAAPTGYLSKSFHTSAEPITLKSNFTEDEQILSCSPHTAIIANNWSFSCDDSWVHSFGIVSLAATHQSPSLIEDTVVGTHRHVTAAGRDLFLK